MAGFHTIHSNRFFESDSGSVYISQYTSERVSGKKSFHHKKRQVLDLPFFILYKQEFQFVAVFFFLFLSSSSLLLSFDFAGSVFVFFF